MTADQENHFSMFKAVEGICQDNIALITPITALNSVYTLFVSNLTAIQDIVLIQESQIGGVAEDKAAQKNKLARFGFVIASIVKAYAVATGNNFLKEEMNYSESELQKARDSKLVTDCQRINARANTHSAALVSYGLTPVMLTDLLTMITDFDGITAAPTIARDHRVVATDELDELIRTTNNLLRFQLDANMQLFDITNPHFLKLYTAARQIIDLKGPDNIPNSGILKGVVKDATTLLIIEGAQIEVLGTEFATESDALGEFVLELLPATYGIRVSMVDYTETELTGLVVVKGEETIAEVMLEAMV